MALYSLAAPTTALLTMALLTTLADLPQCARALAEVATSVGAVALANAALALENDEEALTY